MVSKILGYVLSVAGIGVIALGAVPNLREAVSIVPASVSDVYIMGAGLVVVAFGVFLLSRGSSKGKQPAEVPIYEGKNVVGFRRMGKK